MALILLRYLLDFTTQTTINKEWMEGRAEKNEK
jgi:hypothetical protein